MISIHDEEILVPSVPNPRKQKLTPKGRFSYVDILVAVPIAALWLIVMFATGAMAWWVWLITFVATIGLIVLLIWPLGTLGKEKLYIYIYRMIAYIVSINFYRSEIFETTNKPSQIHKPPQKQNLNESTTKVSANSKNAKIGIKKENKEK